MTHVGYRVDVNRTTDRNVSQRISQLTTDLFNFEHSFSAAATYIYIRESYCSKNIHKDILRFKLL